MTSPHPDPPPRPTVPVVGRFLLVTTLLYFALQTVVVIAHEYAHSTTAWLLGYTSTPRTVTWGNPVTILGWDEGVPYDRLFPTPGHPAEAAIGAAPLLMHALFVLAALALLRRPSATRSRPWFLTLFCFLIVNLTELVAYILMRPFAGSGDTGRFNQGLHLSPWFLFFGGSLFLFFAWRTLLHSVMPRLESLLGPASWQLRVAVWLTAFAMFLWGSGLRILLLYPDRQWRFGLIGLAAFPVWITLNRPRRSVQPT